MTGTHGLGSGGGLARALLGEMDCPTNALAQRAEPRQRAGLKLRPLVGKVDRRFLHDDGRCVRHDQHALSQTDQLVNVVGGERTVTVARIRSQRSARVCASTAANDPRISGTWGSPAIAWAMAMRCGIPRDTAGAIAIRAQRPHLGGRRFRLIAYE